MVQRTLEPEVAIHRSEVKVMEQSKEVARACTDRRFTGQLGTRSTLCRVIGARSSVPHSIIVPYPTACWITPSPNFMEGEVLEATNTENRWRLPVMHSPAALSTCHISPPTGKSLDGLQPFPQLVVQEMKTGQIS